MNSPFLRLLFYGLYFGGAVSCGVFLIAPMLNKIPRAKIKILVVVWLAIIATGCVAQYYGLSYLNDKPPAFPQQVLPPATFLTAIVAGLIRYRPTKKHAKKAV